MFVTSTEITESINKLFNFNKLLYFLNLELTVKSLTHQVISKALLLLSLEDDHNYRYILTELKKNQLIRSPELCMVHKRHTMVYLYIFFHIILNFATLLNR